MGLIRSVGTVSAYTILSRILGVVREMILSYYYGASWVTDAFILAIKVPSFLRRFFAEGALSAAFVPMVSRDIEKLGLKTGVQLTSEVMSLLVTFLTALTLFVIIFSKQVVILFAPGFFNNPEQLSLASNLLAIAFPYIIIIAVVSLLAGLLSTQGNFAVGSASQAILNAVMILALIIWPNNIIPVAWSVLAGGVLQLISMYYVCTKYNMKPRIERPRFSKRVLKILRRMGPGAISSGVFQINLMLDTLLASFLPAGAMSYLYYADRLNQLPLSVFGIAIGTVLLPMLSKHMARNDKVKANQLQEQSLYLGLQLSIPSMVGLFVLSQTVIELIYGHGKFDHIAIHQTSVTLQVFVLGLPGYVLCKNLNNVFFAAGNTKTPLKVAVFGVILNLLCNVIFIKPFAHVGLALSTVVSAWFNAFYLIILLKKKDLLVFSPEFRRGVITTIITASLMAAVLLILTHHWEKHTTTMLYEGIRVMSIVSVGLIFYLLIMYFLKALYLKQNEEKSTS